MDDLTKLLMLLAGSVVIQVAPIKVNPWTWHTKDEFHHIVEINTKYHALIKKHDIQNGVLDAEYAYIEKTYQRCLEKGVFDQMESEDEE